MDRYLGGEAIDEGLLVKDLETAVASARLHPALAVCGLDGRGCTELLDLCVRGFPSPPEHAPQDSFTPAGGSAGPVTCDPDGPLVAEVVRTSSDQYVGRVSIVRVFSGTLLPDAPVHVSGHFSAFFADVSGHEDHDEDERAGSLAHPFGQHQATAEPDRGRRHRRGRTALSRRDRRHPVQPGEPAGAASVADADAAAAGGDRGGHPLRRGQDVDGAGPAARRGPQPPRGAEPRDRAGRAVGDGRGARRPGARPAAPSLRGGRGVGARRRPHARDVRGPEQGPRSPRQAVRRPRAVRDLRPRGGAAAARVRVRVRRQGGRRCGAAAVHQLGREGRARADGARCRQGLPDGRHPRHPHRRQGAQRRLLRRCLPERGRAGRSATPRMPRRCACWSPTRRSRSSCPASTSAR